MSKQKPKTERVVAVARARRTIRRSRAMCAWTLFQDRAGRPWVPRPYQMASLESRAVRKVHCDGRDVGKTTEIEIMAMWTMLVHPSTEMLIAAQTANHLRPVMDRIVRRFETHPLLRNALVEVRRTPSWFLRFANGFILWGRIAGPRGINFQGLHVDHQIVDEAQEMTETAWHELYQALNAGGSRWLYGVPNGLRNTFYRMAHDPAYERYHWPSTLHPDYDAVKDDELARLYGGRTAPGYIHRVLGEHGMPAHGVFNLDDYLECIDPAIDFVNMELTGTAQAKTGTVPSEARHERSAWTVPVFAPTSALRPAKAAAQPVGADRRVCPNAQAHHAAAAPQPFEAPCNVPAGEYHLGCDLGYARDPSEFVVYRNAEPHLINVARVRLAGVNYARQIKVIRELDRAYRFAGIAIDAGNNGRAVAHQLMAIDDDWCARVRCIDFGAAIETDPLPDGSIPKRNQKEFMTELLVRRMAERTILFPPLDDRETQYANHTYSIGLNGRIVYDKIDDHLIDADRCAVLSHYLATREPRPIPLPPLVFTFSFKDDY